MAHGPLVKYKTFLLTVELYLDQRSVCPYIEVKFEKTRRGGVHINEIERHKHDTQIQIRVSKWPKAWGFYALP